MESPEHAERTSEGIVPAATGGPHRAYQIRIDCEEVTVHEQHLTGAELLAAVGKRSCAFELIAEFTHCENDVIEPFREVGTIEAFSESYEHSKLGDLDHEFYELVKVSDLSHLRIAFIRTHEHEFITTKADRQPNSA